MAPPPPPHHLRWDSAAAVLPLALPRVPWQCCPVPRYMPAYHAYLPALYSEGPDGAEGKPVLSFQIDATRNPVAEADAKPFAP